MKVTDLMLYDWVILNGTKYRVMDFDSDGIITEYCLGEPSRHEINFEPIPLTAEILKANEFELDTPCKMLYQPQEVNGIPNISGKYQYVKVTFRRDEIHKIKIYNSWNNIEYGVVLRSTVMVHQLQHALRLCNLNDIADNFKLPQL